MPLIRKAPNYVPEHVGSWVLKDAAVEIAGEFHVFGNAFSLYDTSGQLRLSEALSPLPDWWYVNTGVQRVRLVASSSLKIVGAPSFESGLVQSVEASQVPIAANGGLALFEVDTFTPSSLVATPARGKSLGFTAGAYLGGGAKATTTAGAAGFTAVLGDPVNEFSQTGCYLQVGYVRPKPGSLSGAAYIHPVAVGVQLKIDDVLRSFILPFISLGPSLYDQNYVVSVALEGWIQQLGYWMPDAERNANNAAGSASLNCALSFQAYSLRNGYAPAASAGGLGAGFSSSPTPGSLADGGGGPGPGGGGGPVRIGIWEPPATW